MMGVHCLLKYFPNLLHFVISTFDSTSSTSKQTKGIPFVTTSSCENRHQEHCTMLFGVVHHVAGFKLPVGGYNDL
eukprot:1430821-Ditylum_brightwellii.AAC.1